MAPTPEAHSYLSQTLDRLKQDLEPHMTSGVYMNFLEGQESRERIRDGFSPEAYRR